MKALNLLEKYLKSGHEIVFQDGECQLFSSSGELIAQGDTLTAVVLALILINPEYLS